jgi:hypothetical protein
MHRRRRPLAIPALACLLLSTGCGSYTQSGGGDVRESDEKTLSSPSGYQWRSVYREDVRTVAVPIFTNRTFAQGAEFTLSKAIIAEIEAHTPYKVVPREKADTVLEGEITNVTLRTISSDARSSLPQEQLYRVRVNFSWKDLRTGKILVQRSRFEQTAPFYPTLGEGVFVGEEINLEKLGLAIAQELQAEW